MKINNIEWKNFILLTDEQKFRLFIGLFEDNKNYESFILKILELNGTFIRYFKDPDIYLQKMAIKSSVKAIKYIKDAPDELKLFSIKKDQNQFITSKI